jgi:hypothetical protein
MNNQKQAKCSICGQPIRTMSGAARVTNAPLVCRQCFGSQSYGGGSQGHHWATNEARSDATSTG